MFEVIMAKLRSDEIMKVESLWQGQRKRQALEKEQINFSSHPIATMKTWIERDHLKTQ